MDMADAYDRYNAICLFSASNILFQECNRPHHDVRLVFADDGADVGDRQEAGTEVHAAAAAEADDEATIKRPSDDTSTEVLSGGDGSMHTSPASTELQHEEENDGDDGVQETTYTSLNDPSKESDADEDFFNALQRNKKSSRQELEATAPKIQKDLCSFLKDIPGCEPASPVAASPVTRFVSRKFTPAVRFVS
ncbi:hypothetical protein R1sor_022295 [Riccia sorocarpa]|uniref:Uncharacterized protein n=1 Tax=Riccia sorocarpa TaxID=122646 RepID=A0ABD3GQB3_9MARC